MAGEPKQIDDGKWWVMLGIALFVDVLELVLVLLPVAGEILAEFIDWMAFATLRWWTETNNINYPGKNRTFWIGFVVGLVPVVNDILPEISLTVWYTRKGYKKQQKALREARVRQEKNNVVEMQKMQKQQMANLKKAA